MSGVAYVFGRINGSTTTDVFEGDDALDRAHAFKRMAEADFPNDVFAVAGNPAAIRERKARIGRDIGMSPERAAEFAGGISPDSGTA